MTAGADRAGVAWLVGALSAARRVVVLTGAGVSAASGVPTFRGGDGLWRSYRAEDLATPEAFARDPRLVWEWYDWRRQGVARCAPNPAHLVLARWTRERPGTTLVTQNVDGLHERAGAVGVIGLHGSIWDVRCAAGCAAGGRARHDVTAPWPELPPRCRHCGAPERPGVVWFGEALDAHRLGRAAAAARAADLLLAVGTSAVVYPAAGLVIEARRAGAATVEINPDDTPMAPFLDLAIRAPAESVLPAIDRLLCDGADA